MLDVRKSHKTASEYFITRICRRLQNFAKISEDVERRGNPGTAAYVICLLIFVNDNFPLYVFFNLDLIRHFAGK